MSTNDFCESLSTLKRLKTVEVAVGNILLGASNPIRVQTMATTDTNNTIATVEQCIRAFQAGSELFRITAQGVKEAKNLANIKKELLNRGIDIPIIADIHFNPEAAIEAALHVDKIRINPGNYADKRAKFEFQEYTDQEYQDELIRVEERFLPLLNICKERNVAIRIGVNHGSLSDRIMSRFGDTPEGMAESAMEFLRICRKHEFCSIVVSMKASNTRVMVQSTRLLVNKMMAEGLCFPLHLGVTEAGEGEDGRIKSAVGIGTLLADGIGDTIRVSLTEDPEYEIPVAKKIVSYFEKREDNSWYHEIKELPYSPFSYSRRDTLSIDKIGGSNPPVVIADLSYKQNISYGDLAEWGWIFVDSMWNHSDQAADYFYFGGADLSSLASKDELPSILVFDSIEEINVEKTNHLKGLKLSYDQLNDEVINSIITRKDIVIFMQAAGNNGFHEQRAFFIRLIEKGVKLPVIVKRDYDDIDPENFQLKSACDLGGLLIDGLGDGILLNAQNIPAKVVCSTSFAILQAARTRISKTEFISCPGCGRTLFNLQETLAKIKQATSHLKGLKIGVMGCIVNGPGEMADADYGYVGAGSGRVSLYKGKEVYKKNISEEIAVEELVNLIKENGDWVER